MLTIVVVSALGTLFAYLTWRYAETRLTNPGLRSPAMVEKLESLRFAARIAGVYLCLPLFLFTLLAEAGPLTVLYLIALLLAGYWLSTRQPSGAPLRHTLL